MSVQGAMHHAPGHFHRPRKSPLKRSFSPTQPSSNIENLKQEKERKDGWAGFRHGHDIGLWTGIGLCCWSWTLAYRVPPVAKYRAPIAVLPDMHYLEHYRSMFRMQG